ncbi:MAG: hypothetical protein V1773_14020 [bacterium]
MDKSNKIREGFWLILMVTVMLFGLNLIPDNTTIFGLLLKPVDIISDLKESDEYNYDDYQFQDNSESSNKKENKLINENKTLSNSLNYASILPLDLSIFGVDGTTEETSKDEVNNITRNVKIIGNLDQMKYFFNALGQTKNDKIRVAHYGDSGIEGDLITAQLREKLQNQFGGKGVGFLAITSQDVKFRTTTEMTFSDTWETASVFTSNPKKLPLGINGEVFIPKGSGWVEYSTTPRRFKNIKTFNTVRLFYSDADNSQITASFDGGEKTSYKLVSSTSVKELTIDPKKSVKNVRLEFPGVKKGYFYGCSLEEGNGIYVDNFPLRGNSGASIKDLPQTNLKDFNKLLNYKLIILQFGLNVANQRQKDFSWYEKEMAAVISHLKTAFPNTSILLISVSDKSVKKGGKFVTDPGVISLLKAQQNIAQDNGIAFWNLFEAMGGPNSMPQWVDSNPPKAFKDYTHFNLDGAADIAELLGDALLDAYKNKK